MKLLIRLLLLLVVLAVSFKGWQILEKAVFYHDKITTDEKNFYNEGLRITKPEVIRAANLPHLTVLLGGSLFHYWFQPVNENWPLVNYGGLEERARDTYDKVKMVATELAPEFIVINAGFCEIHTTVYSGGDIAHALESNLDYMHRMIDAAKSHGTKPILSTLPPVRPRHKLPYTGWLEVPSQKKNIENDAIRTYNQMLRQFAREEHLILIDFHQALADESGQLQKEYALTDGEHLNQNGYKTLSAYLLDQLNEMFFERKM